MDDKKDEIINKIKKAKTDILPMPNEKIFKKIDLR